MYATEDTTTPRHWHDNDDISWNYELGDWSDEDWDDAVRTAADNWSDGANITLDKVTGTSDVDVSKGTAADAPGPCNHIDVWSCAQSVAYNGITNHYYDTNMWFNTNRSWGSGVCPGTGVARLTAALHEFGHAAGWTLHTTISTAVMRGGQPPAICRLLHTHDKDQMDDQYSGH